MTRGLFITFEGGDGSGKTTQSALLAAAFRSEGDEVVTTREPGGTDLGAEIRNMLLHSPVKIAPRAEALLFAADRAHHVATLVRPALERGVHVIQDRYLDSSVAYQGAGRELDPDAIRDISMWAAEGLLPDLTVLLDLDPAVAKARVDGQAKQFDKLESEVDSFRTRLRDGFLQLAEAEPDRFLILDASAPVAELHEAIRLEAARRLTRVAG